jgi:hypothetical protein
MDEKDYIEQRLVDQMDWYDKKSMWNQNWHKRLKVTEIGIAASIPFWVGAMELVGEASAWSDLFKVVVALLGVLIAVVSGVPGIYKFQENWMTYRTTCEMLKHEKFFYETECGPYKEVTDKLCLLVQRVEMLISQENTNWRQYMEKKEEKEAK